MEKWREDLYESNYLAHYGIPGQRKGYTHGHRNGKDVAMTEYEDGSQPSAASRVFNVNKGLATNSGNGINPARPGKVKLISNTTKKPSNDPNVNNSIKSGGALANRRAKNISAISKSNANVNKSLDKTRLETVKNKSDVKDAKDEHEKAKYKDNNKEEYFWERDNKPSERTIYTQQLSGNGHNKNFNNFSQTSKTGLKYSGSKRAGTQYTSSGQQYISTKEIVDPKRKRRGREE